MGYPVSYVFPWNEGDKQSYGWLLLIVWLTFGAIVNAIQLILHSLIPRLHKQPCCRIIIWLSSIDFAFDFICMLQCSASYHIKAFFGEQAFCTAQAFWAELLMEMSGFSIACTMLASYMAIVHNRLLTVKDIDRLHIGALIYCTILSIIGSIAPGQGTLNSSGLFCYTASQFVLEGSLFHLLYVGPLIGTLVFFWYRMYNRVQEMTQFLAKRKINVEARKGQVTMAKRMAWYIYALLLCFVPYEIAVWYSWVTGEHAPYQMWITFGMFGHVLTVLSPILYYILNASARDAVITYTKKKLPCSQYRLKKQREIELTSSLDGRRGSHSGSAGTSTRRAALEEKQFEELVRALSDPSLLNELLKFADERWCSEGILFWIDVQAWRAKINKYSSYLASGKCSPSQTTRSLSQSGTEVSETKETKEMKEMKDRETTITEISEEAFLQDLREFATSIYLTYFVRGAEGAAPLELNIPAEMYNKISGDLSIQLKFGKPQSGLDYSPAILYLFDSCERECLRLLYDNVYLPFSTKVNMPEVVASQERLKSFASGNALPFHVPDSPDLLPTNAGAVSGKRSPAYGSPVVSVVDRSERGGDREDSVSMNTDSQESRFKPSTSTEILHVGIDAGSTLKVMFRENSIESLENTPKLSYKQPAYDNGLTPLHEETVELVGRTEET